MRVSAKQSALFPRMYCSREAPAFTLECRLPRAMRPPRERNLLLCTVSKRSRGNSTNVDASKRWLQNEREERSHQHHEQGHPKLACWELLKRRYGKKGVLYGYPFGESGRL